MPPVTFLTRKPIHRGRILDIGLDRVRLPTGVETELEIIRHPGAAAIVPLTDAGEIVMVHQYRYAAGDYLWEIPAGTLAPGEAPDACAARELSEEAGVAATEMIALGEMLPAPGYTTERIHLFLARGLSDVTQNLDDDEVIAEVRAIPVAEVMLWIRDRSIVDAKTVVAVCRAQARDLFRPPGAAS